MSVIPKSVNPERIDENREIGTTQISEEDMSILDSFDEYLVTGWDPTKQP
jgi:diketogulonate reductase-like aldo/keto reductase